MARAQLSPVFGEISGKLGDLVVVQLRTGTAIKRKSVYKRAMAPSQQAAGQRFKQAMAVWNTLSPTQAASWDAYGKTLERHDSLTGHRYSPAGINAFTMLATRFLMVEPLGDIPVAPPSGSFVADDLQVEVGSLPLAVVFEASRPNNTGSVTELMLQKLKSPRRRPGTQYTAAKFVSFEPGHMSENVTVTPGVYACAYRFIERSTGRATTVLPIGVVEVS